MMTIELLQKHKWKPQEAIFRSLFPKGMEITPKNWRKASEKMRLEWWDIFLESPLKEKYAKAVQKEIDKQMVEAYLEFKKYEAQENLPTFALERKRKTLICDPIAAIKQKVLYRFIRKQWGYSSDGRALVSKTKGREFDPSFPRQLFLNGIMILVL